MELLDLPIYQCLVSPALCKDLADAGLTKDTPYFYRVTNGIAQLECYAFDKDDIYRQGDANVDAIMPPDALVPAYQLKDVEKVIPDFLITRAENNYELSVEHIYGLPTVKHRRLPDAFALMVLQGLRNRVINLRIANTFITARA